MKRVAVLSPFLIFKTIFWFWWIGKQGLTMEDMIWEGVCVSLSRGADLIIYDTGESTEEVHQGSAEIRLFTEEVTQWTVYIL